MLTTILPVINLVPTGYHTDSQLAWSSIRRYFTIDNFFSFLRCYCDAVEREGDGGAMQRELS